MEVTTIVAQAKDKMNKTLHLCEEKLQSIRTGQANVQQYEHISVNYYGTPTPLNQVGSITVPEPRLVVIQPWDANIISDIEKAIMNSSNLSGTPQSDGTRIRINVPPLTDETRQQSIKQAKEIAEESKVSIRNIRREANDKLKKLEHDSEISQDDLKHHEHTTQEMTNDITQLIQEQVDKKEKEILEV